AEIVKTIIALGHNLNMKVVAEGVETESQAQKLRDLDCEYGQGYFFAKPLPPEAAEALLRDAPRYLTPTPITPAPIFQN
ncbi:MAG: EAL domain-containing protein, partial [Cyanobacteria bacterium J06635_1]